MNDVDSLAFQAGDWVLTIWDYRPGDTRGAPMTDAQHAVWATHLHARQTPDGFLTLEPELPLSWSRADVPDAELRSGSNAISVIFRRCAGTELLGSRNANGFIVTQDDTGQTLCDPTVPVVVGVVGDSTFEHQMATLFQLRNLNGPVPSH